MLEAALAMPEEGPASEGRSPDASHRPATVPMIVIVGPTASGKSALAVVLARRWGGEVVNYDSVQVYRGFDIGSGKLRPAERHGVPHHLVDVVDAGQVFTAGDYRREAIAVLARLCERGRLPVLVGGTGLYLRALLQGLFEGPQRSETLRARLRGVVQRRGGAFLHRILRRLDPTTATRIHPNDTQKVLRAVEVCWLAKEPMSRLLARGRNADGTSPTGHVGQVGQVGLPGYQTIKVGLDPDRAALHQRINARVESMFREGPESREGLLDEVRAALSGEGPETSGPGNETLRPEFRRAERIVGTGVGKPLEALGYRQACALVRGEITMEVAVRDTQTATRQYAKRQMTWFRREDDVTWFRGFGDDSEVQRQIAGWAGSRLESSAIG
ncbi:MAG: tRNA (adenosine(37)-N6)-dimethylallyltransferase MiaA [Terriglobia bacterium]